MTMIVFDCETAGFNEETIRSILPPLDRSKIPVGNRGPEKAEEYRDDYEAKHWQKAVEQAALDPLTGELLAVGYFIEECPNLFPGLHLQGRSLHDGAQGSLTEADLLKHFWYVAKLAVQRGILMVGHNSNEFDLPFLLGRSRIQGVRVPDSVIERGRYWHPNFVDTMQRWFGGARTQYVGIATLGRALELGGKLEGVEGKDFARLLREDRDRALAYLQRDVELTYQVALRLGIH